MMNFTRRDRIGETKAVDKSALKPALYDPPVNPNRNLAPNTTRPSSASAAVPLGPQPTALSHSGPPSTGVTDHSPPTAAKPADAQRSRLHVGINIQLKGVEISECDILVIEGNVEATVHSKAMEIAKPGTLKGTVFIDVAEIHGEFSGELTARTRLVVHGTGRVSGTIRYGKLVVEEGGEVSGDVKRVDETEETTAHATAAPAKAPGTHAHAPLGPPPQGMGTHSH